MWERLSAPIYSRYIGVDYKIPVDGKNRDKFRLWLSLTLFNNEINWQELYINY